MGKSNGGIVLTDALGQEQATEPDEPRFVVTQTDLEMMISSVSVQFAEIIARAEMVANAEPENLQLAVEALQEAFDGMDREHLQALAKNNA